MGYTHTSAAQPKHVTTQRPEAIAAAKKSLGPAVMQLLERPGASVADLLSTLYP
jgi:hypothetical protein